MRFNSLLPSIFLAASVATCLQAQTNLNLPIKPGPYVGTMESLTSGRTGDRKRCP
jgi:hypothetical protein